MDDNTEKPAGKRRRSAVSAPTIELGAREIAASSPVGGIDASVGDGSSLPAGAERPDVAAIQDAVEAAVVAGEPDFRPEPLEDRVRTPEPEPAFASDPAFAPEPHREGPAFMPILAAALIGSVAGAAIMLALASVGVVPGLRSAGEESARLAGIEQDVASTRQILDQTVGRVAVVETAARTASASAGAAANLAEEARAAAKGASGGGSQDLQASLAPVSEQANAAAATATKVETDLTATQKRIADLEATAAAPGPEKAAAYSVALSQLAEAIRLGRPFEAELKAASGLAPDPAALSGLSAPAAKGLPPLDALARSYDAALPAVEAALAPKGALQPDAGVLDRLWARLGTTISVTREGEVPAGDPMAPALAVSSALRRGDLEAAIEAFSTMPEPARAAGAAWFAEARAVLDALTLVRTETNAALLKLSQK